MSDNVKRTPINVEVVFALPEVQWLISLQVDDGCTAREVALLANFQTIKTPEHEPNLDPSVVPLGVFGERVDDDYVLQPGDRVELYRPLQLDPMEARRRRARS